MPKGLTKASIVAAALHLLDEVGMDGMTVRALAAKLDVKAPALYWHVRDKAELDELLDADAFETLSSGSWLAADA